jgi:hypothetical protein
LPSKSLGFRHGIKRYLRVAQIAITAADLRFSLPFCSRNYLSGRLARLVSAPSITKCGRWCLYCGYLRYLLYTEITSYSYGEAVTSPDCCSPSQMQYWPIMDANASLAADRCSTAWSPRRFSSTTLPSEAPLPCRLQKNQPHEPRWLCEAAFGRGREFVHALCNVAA